MPKPIAVTCGDPAGVGPEIIETWLREDTPHRDAFCVLGPRSWVETLADRVSVCSVGDGDFQGCLGKPSEPTAAVALAALEAAASGCVEGHYGGVVTAPVSKAWLSRVGYPYPGQTEFFAARWGGEPTMAFAGGKLAVVLATWHIPLMEVASALTESALTLAVERADWLARRLGAVSPRIAVCGLNPHAGEGGLLGREEQDCINPVLERLRGCFPGLSTTLPGDTVFRRQLLGDFDVCVALYHDQGLAPLKTLEFETAVNITLGLPWVRTSPDHGTGFDIAGRGLADASSFKNAVRLVKKLTHAQ